jgi:uncharacterized protein involved in exopolysaccharide biosynthesis
MKKSTSYRQTFREHRRLLSLPIVLAALVAAWAVLGSAKTYESTTSLWVDNPAPADSSLGTLNPALTPPAQQEQNVVTELLATRSFVLAVGHNSGLGRYVAAHKSSGFGPGALLSGLSGGGSLDEQIIAALSASQVTTTVAGPQVLQISFVGPTPTVTASTLQALVSQLQSDSAAFIQQHSNSALAYYKAQVQAASQALVSARQQASAYVSQHRRATSGDPNYSALTTAEGVANTQLTQATQSYNEAASALYGGGGGSSLHVIDPAGVPTSPMSGKKKQLMGIAGGLFAGLLISFLGVIALTKRKPSEPWEDELRGAMPASELAPSTPWWPPPSVATTERSSEDGPIPVMAGGRFVEQPALGD